MLLVPTTYVIVYLFLFCIIFVDGRLSLKTNKIKYNKETNNLKGEDVCIWTEHLPGKNSKINHIDQVEQHNSDIISYNQKIIIAHHSQYT